MTHKPPHAPSPAGLGRPVIDCDLHNEVPRRNALLNYLPDHWLAYFRDSGFEGPDANDYPSQAAITTRPGVEVDSSPGRGLAEMRRHALDPWQTEIGILTCGYRVQSVQNEDLAAALASAVNDWQIDQWLNQEPRLRASLVVPSQNPELAAREIDRLGGHPGFVQVMLPVRSDAPYGTRRYDPLFEAAVRHDLAVGIHFGGAPGFPPTPAGWPTTYLEEYTVMSMTFQAQLTSLVFAGAFARFPGLRVALVESGFEWIPAWMWRADKDWKALRSETPWVSRPPSDYVRDHVRVTLQPLGVPAEARQLREAADQLESTAMLMFSTDYPHHHFDDPADAFPAALADGLSDAVLTENARAFYRL